VKDEGGQEEERSARAQPRYTAPLVPVHELYGVAPTCVGLSSGGEIPSVIELTF